MRQTIVVLGFSLVVGSVAGWAQGPPQAAPEHKRLAYFAGTWTFTGKAEASPMGPAGAISFKEVCELMEGGFALVCRSDGKSPMGPTKAHSIMSYDVEKKAYTYTAAENKMPVFTALGQTTGPTWNWTTESKMDGKLLKTRVTIKEVPPSAYDFLMEIAIDSGAFTKVIEGKASRAGT
jgi:hypothetical protein